MLYYHAGMIAVAAGHNAAGRAYLARAIDLGPRFDPLQAPLAKRALEKLNRNE